MRDERSMAWLGPEPVPGYRRRTIARPLTADAAEGLPALGVGRSLRDASEGTFGALEIEEVVLGRDDRALVPTTTAAPWRHVCALRILTADGVEFAGTGWFASERCVVTAGHCLYLRKHGGWAARVEVIPALRGRSRPFGTLDARRWATAEQWLESPDAEFDYGALLLDEPVGQRTGWFSFAALEDGELMDADASISGYPIDRDGGTHQYYHSRAISQVSHRRLHYGIDTYGGQSGSPIWLRSAQEDERLVVGIHTTGSSSGNSGTRISPQVFDWLSAWIEGRSHGRAHERS